MTSSCIYSTYMTKFVELQHTGERTVLLFCVITLAVQLDNQNTFRIRITSISIKKFILVSVVQLIILLHCLFSFVTADEALLKQCCGMPPSCE